MLPLLNSTFLNFETRNASDGAWWIAINNYTIKDIKKFLAWRKKKPILNAFLLEAHIGTVSIIFN